MTGYRYGADGFIGPYLEVTVAVEDMDNDEPAILARELRTFIDKCVATYTNRPVDTQGHSA